MAYILHIRSTSGPAREVPLSEGEMTIGRDPRNAIVLTGRGVSRRHAKIICRQDRVTLVDLGSTYGTKINDMPTLRREVRLGDQITIGMHTLEIHRPSSTASFSTEEAPVVVEPHPRNAYAADEVTYDPSAKPPHIPSDPRPTGQFVEIDSGALQFLDDGQEQAEILGHAQGQIMEAVQRLETGLPVSQGSVAAGPATIAPRTADYHALLLMYKVSQLLGEAADLDAFVSSVADLVMEEVQANTVVVLTGQSRSELEPLAIRHRGALDEGEVPISHGVIDLVFRTGSPVISGDALNDDRIAAGQSLALYNIRAMLAAPLLLKGEIRGILYLNRAGPIPFSKSEGELVSALAALMTSGMERAELRQRVDAERQRRHSLERFHPPEVVDQITAGADSGMLREHDATVLVCDILDFESLTKRIAPQELAQLLGDYYDLVYEKVFGNTGSLVKLYDGWALALFGMHATRSTQSPPNSREAVWAVEAARQLIDEFSALTALWPASANIKLSCAVDTGKLIAGVVGPTERLEYVALGKPIASTRALLAAQKAGLLLTENVWATVPQRHFRAQLIEGLLPDAEPAFLLES